MLAKDPKAMVFTLRCDVDVPGMKGGGAGIWKKLQALSGVHVTLYSLRHFFVEQSLSAGVPLHVPGSTGTTAAG